MVIHTCERCNKEFNKKSHYLDHIARKYPCKDIRYKAEIIQNPIDLNTLDKNTCIYCKKKYSNIYNLNKHYLICKLKLNIDIINKISKLEQKIITIEQKDQGNIKKPKNNIVEKLEIINDSINKITQPNPLNDKLINMVIQKDNLLEEIKPRTTKNKLVNIIDDKVQTDNNEIIKPVSLILNDVVILSRPEDNYINATQLCQAGNKKFNDWFRLDTTKELINVLEADAGIPASGLIDIIKGGNYKNNQGSWIHPDLACPLAQWISPLFAFQVSKWIRTLFTNGNIDIKALKDKDILIKNKDKKIKVLENLCVKKHKREEYPEKNVIYILTTEEHKKNRTYIIGKAKNLKERLTPYNKTCNHEVVYYKECKSEEDMKIIEEIVINKLDKYKEVANRDRFVLPIDNDIKLFTNEIDNAIKYFN